ncbi:MAG: AAA family ATPase [Roseiflexaceae bacterium]
MYIDKISLRNIRGFESLDFHLARPDNSYAGLTVITGDNGSGKSTLLKAIAVCLIGRETARTLQGSFNGWIRRGIEADEASIELDIVRVEKDDELINAGRKPQKHFPAKMTLKNGGRETTLSEAIPSRKQNLKSYQTPERTIWSSDADGWFSCGYGPFRRIFGASSEATRIMTYTATARFATMFDEAASLYETDRWLRELDHKAREGSQSEQGQRQRLIDLLNNDLMPNYITVDNVNSDGIWLKDRNDVKLGWKDMSDGYRTVIALLTDIIRHLTDIYNDEDIISRDQQGYLYVNRSGVVLIDELDAHLHPEWQREIGFWLKRHFPKIQFIVTTHSPLICQAADPNGLFVLPEPGSEEEPRALTATEYQKIIASRPDTILLTPAFDLQNTRSPEVVEARKEFARLQVKKRTLGILSTEDQQRLDELSELVTIDEEL